MEWFIIVILLIALAGLGVITYALFQQQKLTHAQVKNLQSQLVTATQAPVIAVPMEQPKPVIAPTPPPPVATPTPSNDTPIYHILADGAYDVLLVIDTHFNILATNESAEKLFNKSALTGSSLKDITDLPELELMVSDALVNEEESFEEQMMYKERHYRVRTQVYRHDDRPYVRLAMSDITQLVKLNRARRDMVANISHELRTPIANIRLIIDNLFHDQDKPKRKDSISSLRNIARETENLMWLVQEMSDLSMIESGQSIVRMIENNLRQMVLDAIERLEQRIEVHNIIVQNNVPAHFMVLCDRDLVQRVLVNLVHNAIKWSPQGETIVINAQNGGDEVTISVFDNGPGVSPEQVDRIFERFYQVDASRSGGEGTGLGLAICRHIVEAHGGKIWAEANTVNKGGRFFFTLLSALGE
ncbi:MAG: HAMP domain-containing histidine kinase [Anaerolineae bacterium]|nr:HAMP domain-containing histidine kinase [Anaerolineae bacterium]